MTAESIDADRADAPEPSAPVKPAKSLPLALLDALGSLKLTVVLFALSTVLVFVGTLAQVNADMWEVLDRYFKSYLVMIDLKVLAPPSFFPEFVQSDAFKWIEPLRFPFPGGASIGIALSLNLIAAHLRRFKVQASGQPLLIGSAIMAVGALMTLGVIISGNFQDGLQTEPFVSYAALWWCFKIGLVGLWLAMLYGFVALPSERWIEQRLLLVGTVIMTVILVCLFYYNWQLYDAGMRILWQLTKGVGAGVVLLIGAVMVFKRRAGIVVLHAGVGVMMVGVMIATLYSVEEQMRMAEGESLSYTQDQRTSELAVIDTTPQDHDDVVVVPLDLLLRQGVDRAFDHQELPFTVQVDEHFANADLKPVKPGEKTQATAGAGRTYQAVAVREAAGTDTEGRFDLPAAYVTFRDKQTNEVIDTHLVSILQTITKEPEKVSVGDKTYDVYLRFKRTYRPFTFTLLDVRKDNYAGTDTPKNFSSDVHLVDPSQGEDRKIHIRMNEPLRYSNLTFYQTGYNVLQDGTEITDLQVVRNLGWMTPYVACSIVGVGMFWHFSLTLLRFLRSQPQERPRGLWATRLGAAAVGLMIIVSVMMSGRRILHRTDFDLQAAGQLPVMYEGRVKPLDTLARSTMRAMSNRSTFRDSADAKQPAIRWVMDLLASDPIFNDGKTDEAFKKHPVFRIDNLEVLKVLGLERRSGFRYALEEFEEKLPDLEEQVREARELEPEEMNVFQRKLIETERRITAYRQIEVAFGPSFIPSIRREDPTSAERALAAITRLRRFHPPLAVPTEFKDAAIDEWQPYASARAIADIQESIGQEPDPATIAWTKIIKAYADDNAEAFNEEVSNYLSALSSNQPTDFDPQKNRAESLMNMYSPFTMSMVLYVMAFVMGCMAWLFSNNRRIRSVSSTLIVVSLVVHSVALIARIYISGRPPVTNLYSSAVFIGWGTALLAIVLEAIIPLGVGNIVSALTGFSTLLVAAGLEKGDTMAVLQAVLDTQFWLATHVVSITLGYATTVLAGFLGAVYIVLGVFTPKLSKTAAREITRMTYGVLCFAIFFSFIGTVLGGLWADDSWGRFWGWDPKENGALLIVIWNALVLHARWGGMIRQRGLAVLAIAGNIVTAWSWFGTNELGVGLHSYGFTEGALMRLGLFILSQLALIVVGCLPLHWWLSHRAEPEQVIEAKVAD